MIWLNPAAWFALVAVAAPILIHIFVQRKARPIAFPTLRFLQPTRLAAIRRHLLEDLPLLVVRAAILAAAVAAFAAPFVVRRQAWNARVTRAVVVDETVSRSSSLVSRATSNQQPATSERTFETRSLADGIRRARIWFESVPPARREIVIVSPLAQGSLTASMVASIPPEIGLRFERVGELPKEQTVDAGGVIGLESQVASRKSRAYRRTATIAVDGTAVKEEPADTLPFPVDVIAAPAARTAVDRAIAAVLERHVWAPPPDRLATLAFVGSAKSDAAIAKATPLTQPWMADAVARIALDEDLESVAARSVAALDPARFGTAPWVVAVRSSNHRPLAAAAAAGGRLVIATAFDPTSFLTPLLLRAAVDAMAQPPDLRSAEVIPISDDQLNAWTRAPGPVTRVRFDAIGTDDRRWLWVLALVLLAVETWMRRRGQISEFRSQTAEDRANAA